MSFAKTFTAKGDGKRMTFRCTRCAFAAVTSMLSVAEGRSEAPTFFGQTTAQARAAKEFRGIAQRYLDLFPCPLCGGRRSRVGLALRCVGSCIVLVVPVTLVATMIAFFGMLKMGGPERFGITTPFLVTGVLTVLALVTAGGAQWRRDHGTAEEMVQLQRFWEWKVPDGPRILAAQDEQTCDAAVWIDGKRAAEPLTDDGYRIPLAHRGGGDPYRGSTAELKLVFPANGTCWLTLGGKRIEPVRTSSDVV